jgi:hypothetical protein
MLCPPFNRRFVPSSEVVEQSLDYFVGERNQIWRQVDKRLL